MDLSIAVVIPYYQREPGLLRRALESVAAQTHPPSQVVVVDDGSPRSAGLELAGTQLQQQLRGFTLVLQHNGGISRARNAALASLSPDIEAVAFLDSDEVWRARHLEYAATAFADGADLFFSNFHRQGEAADAFDEPGRSHLKAEGTLVEWTQGVASLMRSSCPFTTSSVAYRRSIMPRLRFPTDYRRAGEDQVVFWQLCCAARRIIYSTEVTVDYDDSGVGTWHNAGWGTLEGLIRLSDEIRLRHHILKHFPVLDSETAEVWHAIKLRREYALLTALHLMHHRHNAYGEVLRLLWIDPGCLLTWGALLPQRVRQYLRH